MVYKVGDKVSFLNEKRNGFVKKIINNQMVSVEIEDGFEIPVLTKELVKVQSAQEKEREERYAKAGINEPLQYEEESNEDEESLSKALFLKDEKKYPRDIYLAYVHDNETNLSSGNINILLVNHTSYEIVFTYALLSNGQYIDEDYDITGPETSYLLNQINVSQVNDWQKIKFQVLFFTKGYTNKKKPIVKETILNPVKIYRDNSYQYLSLINKKCILLPFSNELENFDWEEAEAQNKVEPTNAELDTNEEKKKEQSFPQKFLTGNKIAEVDIHIWQLTNNYRNMSNGEIVNLQLNYFRNYLDLAIKDHIKNIVFIHGVGNGTLKGEIRKTLDEMYPKLTYSDASMAKYGVGATEIEIPHNYNR